MRDLRAATNGHTARDQVKRARPISWGSSGRRFKSCQPDVCDVSGHRNSPNLQLRFGFFLWGAGSDSAGLIVAGGVDGEFANEFSGDGVDDSDAEVLAENQHSSAGVGSADADVVQSAGEA